MEEVQNAIKDLEVTLKSRSVNEVELKKIKRKIMKLKKKKQRLITPGPRLMNSQTYDQDDIIEQIKQNQKKDSEHFLQFIQDSHKKPIVSSDSHVYKRDNLLTSLLLDQILHEKVILLQAFQHLEDHHFFQEDTTPVIRDSLQMEVEVEVQGEKESL